MNIDISNAHCGPRIQFLDHAWLRVVHVTQILLALRIVYSSYIWSFFFFVIPAVVLKSNVSESGVKNRGQVTRRRCATYERLLDVRWRSSRSWPRLKNRNACARVWYEDSCSRITTNNMSRTCVSVLGVVSRHVSCKRDDRPCFTASCLFSTLFRTESRVSATAFDSSVFWSRITYRAPNVVWN